jgi:hypothetical protein
MRRTLIGLIAGIAIGIAFISMSGIGSAAEGEGEAGGENPLTAWIPDLKLVFNGALHDVFLSSGAEINDPMIADFYGKLTTNMAANVSEADGAAVAYEGPVFDFPMARIAAPTQSSRVQGQVVVQVDAIDDVDQLGSLAVSILIDGITSVVAGYSPASGYYEAIWDSSAIPTGTLHTIVANVIDSEGNTASALSVVSVE